MAAAMSCRSATRLVDRCTAPIWVRSPNLSTVAMEFTTVAANSSYTSWCRGLSISPTKKPKLRVAARTMKKPKMTFSRFMARGSRGMTAPIIGRGGLRLRLRGVDEPIHVEPAAVFPDEAAGLVEALGAPMVAVAGDELHHGAVRAVMLMAQHLQADPAGQRRGSEVHFSRAGGGVPG